MGRANKRISEVRLTALGTEEAPRKTANEWQR